MRKIVLSAAALFACISTAHAQDIADPSGFFVSLNGGASIRSGSSSTTNGGFNRDGIVYGVSFSTAYSVGGRVGYRFGPRFSAFASFDHIDGRVSYNATYPSIGRSSHFSGRAVSDVLLANVAYSIPLVESTRIDLGAGVGMSINSLLDIAESNAGGQYAAIHDRSTIDPAARLSLGLTHQVTSNFTLGIESSLTYTGGFVTSSKREFFGSGPDTIVPYRLDDVASADIGVSLRLKF